MRGTVHQTRGRRADDVRSSGPENLATESCYRPPSTTVPAPSVRADRHGEHDPGTGSQPRHS